MIETATGDRGVPVLRAFQYTHPADRLMPNARRDVPSCLPVGWAGLRILTLSLISWGIFALPVWAVLRAAGF
jgi:hypothetical protein